MAEPTGPRVVFERLIDGIAHKRVEDLPLLYAEDTDVLHPFAGPPSRLRGRERLREHFRRLPDLPLELRARNVVVHETADPEVIVAEFDYDGRVTTTGRTFTAGNIVVMRVRDGEIVESRDYHDHRVLESALESAFGREP
jgi:ketosteroid isomerase-like protein